MQTHLWTLKILDRSSNLSEPEANAFNLYSIHPHTLQTIQKEQKMALTDQEIMDSKAALKLHNAQHEHNDCIRMAYEWLDAQKTTRTKRSDDWKHLVEFWCGRSITPDDLKIAAHLHPKIERQGDELNIGKRMTLPSFERLIGISEAKTQVPRMSDEDKRRYASREK